MKKILFMVSSMNIGGVEKSLLSLISTIPKSKYSVTILMLEKKGGFLKDIPSWVKVKEFDCYSKVKPIIMQPPRKTLRRFFSNKNYIKALIFSIIYLISKYFNNRYLYYKFVFNEIDRWEEKVDIAISYHGPTDIIDYYIGNKVSADKKISWVHFDVSKHKINEKLYKRIYKRYSKIMVVSKGAKNNLITKVPSVVNKTMVFTNVISGNLIWKMSQERVKFDDDYKGVKIVTVGRLSWEKGQDMAIKVLYELQQKGFEVRWYCVGEGKQRKEYEQLIESFDLGNDFVLLGAKSNPYPFIRESDIYVQPSRHEGYCLTLAEAKCLNKPIVTTNFTGANEQIKNNESGLIVDIDKDKIYLAITELMKNPRLCKRLSNNLSKESFNPTKVNQISI